MNSNGAIATPKPKSTKRTEPEPSDETLYLIGRPTLKQFLRFIAREAVNPEDEATLITEWQAAKEHIGKLEKEERA